MILSLYRSSNIAKAAHGTTSKSPNRLMVNTLDVNTLNVLNVCDSVLIIKMCALGVMLYLSIIIPIFNNLNQFWTFRRSPMCYIDMAIFMT